MISATFQAEVERNESRMNVQNHEQFAKIKFIQEQECIPVECVPSACWPYPSMHCAGGVSARWVSARGRGVYPSMQWGRHPPPWTDRHL